jgi:hypothetical protein
VFSSDAIAGGRLRGSAQRKGASGVGDFVRRGRQVSGSRRSKIRLTKPRFANAQRSLTFAATADKPQMTYLSSRIPYGEA